MISFIKKSLIVQLFIGLLFTQICFCMDTNDELLDKMERGDIKHTISTPDLPAPQGLSWTQVATLSVHFVTSLFQPITDLASQTAKYITTQYSNAESRALLDQLESGESIANFQHSTLKIVPGIAKQLIGDVKDKVLSVGGAIKDNPLESASLGVGLALSWTGVGEIAPAVTTSVVGVINGVRNSKMLYSLAQSIDGEKAVTKVLKIGLYGGAIFTLAAFPAAAALEWNSLVDARAHYSNPVSCYETPTYGETWRSVMSPVASCLRGGGSLESCQAQIPTSHGSLTVGSDLYAFTRHASDIPELNPVSIVQLDGQKTCFLTALDTQSPVTKTCFMNLADLDTRTVEVVPGLTLLRAHEGLAAGQSVRHVGLHLDSTIRTQASCGHFSEASAKYELGSKPSCLLTALTPGGEVTQMCFDPQNPETLTLKKIEGISLDFADNGGKPVSIVIKDPSKFGLDVKPQGSVQPPPSVLNDVKLQSSVQPHHPSLSGIKEVLSVCDGEKCYEYQKVEVPCDKKDEL